MQKLIAELKRLYLMDGDVDADMLARQFAGEALYAFRPGANGAPSRAMVIPFNRQAGGEDAQHWALLCRVANAMQAELGMPAPAVSISGERGFGLWVSLERAVPATEAQEFMDLLRLRYFAEAEPLPPLATADIELPPSRHARTGRWAAFINPGLGASFADESGLEMQPPLAGQVALLEGVASVTDKQFAHALDVLRQSHGTRTTAKEPAGVPAAGPRGVLLADATLEDIVEHLHSLNIEPTFRHVIRK